MIVYSPMHAGLLTGAFSAERVASLPDDDWRKSDDDFTKNLDANLPVAERWPRWPSGTASSTAAAAAAWTIAWPGVSGAIVGARSAEQVDGWLDAATLTYDDEDLATRRVARSRRPARGGPAGVP